MPSQRWKANSYVLAVSLLVAEYVRQTREQDGGSSAEASGDTGAVDQASLNELLLFLCREIQHPLQDEGNLGLTSLAGLLGRLQHSMSSTEDFEALSAILVGILAKIDSPDAVENVIDRIAECVAPLDGTSLSGANGNATNAVLMRQSFLGIFVRKFLLAASRLLFDGLSRLFDDVRQYVQEFRDVCLQERNRQPVVWRGDAATDLPLSPIIPSSVPSKMNGPAFAASPQLPPPLVLRPTPPAHSRRRVADRREDGNGPAHDQAADAWSSEQVDFILNDAIHCITKGNHRLAGSGKTDSSSSDIKVHVKNIAERQEAADRSVLFVKYLDLLHLRDYQGALHALHQYHDVIPSDYLREKGSLAGAPSPDQRTQASASAGGGVHFRGTGVQYAALNLAGLQIAFDYYDAAQESIQEAIRVAQHHGDHLCVAFALSWLIQIMQRTGRPKHDVLALARNSMERAKELYLPTLKVLSALVEVETDLTRGSSDSISRLSSSMHLLPHVIVCRSPGTRPRDIWNLLQQGEQDAAATIDSSFNSISEGGGRFAGPHRQPINPSTVGGTTNVPELATGGMAWIKSADAVLDSMWKLRGKTHLSSAATWQLFGSRTLEQAFNQIFAACYEDAASMEEITQVVGRMALHCPSGNGGAENVYVDALNTLLDAVSRIDTSIQEHWVRQAPFQRMIHSVLFTWALRRGEFPRAWSHLRSVQHLSPIEKDLTTHFEAQLSEAVLLSAVGDVTRSISLLQWLQTKCIEFELAHLLACVLLTTSKVQLKWLSPHASCSALPSILKCIDICRQHNYDLMLAEAHLVMADLFVGMGKIQDAYVLVSDEMPLITQHGSGSVRGNALFLLAKVLIPSVENGDGTDSSRVERVIKLLSDSAEMFQATQDLQRLQEVRYLTALLCNHAAVHRTKNAHSAFAERRDEASTQFLECKHALCRGRSMTIDPADRFESLDGIRALIDSRSSKSY